MSNINQAEISQKENRTLAKFKPLILEDNEINFNFGKDFEEWFGDRFYLREKLISSYDKKLILQKNWTTKNVIKGKDGWLFLNGAESINSYTNKIMFTEDELKEIIAYLKNIDDYCNKNNKKFYFIIAPDKSKIYGEFYTDSIKQVQEHSRVEQLIEYINQHSKIKVIYPKNKLISAKGKIPLYYKTDTHWNLLGSYTGYQELMNIVKKDYSNISIYKIAKYKDENNNGDLYNMAPKLLRKEDKTIYKLPDVEYKNLCSAIKDKDDVVCYNKNANLSLVMYRDSFSNALIPYISNTFKHSKYIWQYKISKNTIKNADVVVLEVVERFLPLLLENKSGD